MRGRPLLGGLFVLIAGLVAAAPPAGAARLDGGCAGSATSFGDEGAPLDSVDAPGRGGTSKDPFVVDPGGTVAYEGSTPTAFRDHSWSIDVMGITVKSGGSENADGVASTSGEVDVDEYLPVNAVGLFKVSGGISSDGGSCSGSAWIKVEGSPVGTVPWAVGVVATAVGIAALAGPAVGAASGLLRRGA